MITVTFKMSPSSVFQYAIDGVFITVADGFRPEVGHRLHIDRITDIAGKAIMLDVFVIAVEWSLKAASPRDPPYSAELVLTVASEPPPTRTSRIKHGG